jgi:hypothetical protein
LDFNDNCNPTTIVIPNNSEQTIKFKIHDINNIENFKEKEIVIKNTNNTEEIEDKNIVSEKIENNITTDSNDNIEKSSSDIIIIPDFNFILQSPSYINKLEE